MFEDPYILRYIDGDRQGSQQQESPFWRKNRDKQFQPNEKASEKTLTDEKLMETEALCAQQV